MITGAGGNGSYTPSNSPSSDDSTPTDDETENTRTDLNKLLDFHLRKITPMAFLEVVEIQLAEHCNLNCFGCNHFSQIAQKEFLSLETFTKDLTRLSEISKGFIGNLRLMGGSRC